MPLLMILATQPPHAPYAPLERTYAQLELLAWKYVLFMYIYWRKVRFCVLRGEVSKESTAVKMDTGQTHTHTNSGAKEQDL